MSRKAHTFVKKVLYPVTIASMVLWSLGPAAMPSPAYAAITTFTATASATSSQTISPSSVATPVFGLNTVATAGETIDVLKVAIAPSAGFAMSDLASLTPNGTCPCTGTSGIALYRDDGTTQGAFDSSDANISLGNLSLVDGSTRISKLTPPAGPRQKTDTSQVVSVGDLMFADVSAGGAPTTGYAWHVVTTGATGVSSASLRLDGAGTQPTFRGTSTYVSTFIPATSESYVINGTSNTVPAALTTGDIIFYQTGTAAGQWGLVTGNFSSTAAPVNGSNLSNGTYRISKVIGQTGSFVIPANGAIPAPGSGYTLPVNGDLVLYRSSGAAGWGIVTNAALTSGTFAVDNMVLMPGTYQISKITMYNPASALTTAIPTGGSAIQYGDVVFGLPALNPVSTEYGWHMSTGDTTPSAADHRLDDRTAAPVYGFSAYFDPMAEVVPANDTGNNTGDDYYIAFRTSSTAVNGHAFKVSVAPGTFNFGSSVVAGLPTETSTPTYTIGTTTATQTQSAGANTTVMDTTGGFLRLKQSSNFKPVARIQFGSNENTKTLTSVVLSFAAANSTTPTWTASGAVSSELLDLATTGGGISLWKDGGSPGFGLNGAGDTQVTLAASPVYGASNAFTITPATPPTIASDDVYFVVLKSDTSGVTNNNAFTVNLAANAITTSGTSPTIGVFATPPIVMDTTAPTISSVSDMPGQSTKLMARFSEPVRKINEGGALTTTDFTYTNDATNGSGRTLSSISHNPGQDFAELTMSGALAAGDFDGTPSTLAAGASKIEDSAGNAMATTAANLASPLTITTAVIPQTYVGAVYDATTPLVTFAAVGGTGTYTPGFAVNSTADGDVLTALGLSLAGNGKLTGTIAANTAGTRNVTIKVTDSGATTTTKQFTINITASQGGGMVAITNVAPQSGTQGATNLSMAITGTNTSFSGTSVVAFLLNGSADSNITVGTVTATSATSITVPVTIAGGTATGSRDVRVTSGSQVVTMPGGFNVAAVAAAGLNLVFPIVGATNIQLPQPGFNFNPSTNTTFTHYRIVVSATQDFATALWDYVFPKPDTLGTNGSHCTTSSCNVNYGEGRFLRITAPTTLASNTTYYWKVETYQDPTPTTQFSSSDVTDINRKENTPVRSFTTSASITDVQPPQIEHRPIVQARANAALALYARVLDNIANASSTPALATTLYACQGGSCTVPATTVAADTSATDGVVAGSHVANGYYSYVIPAEIIGATASTTIKYYIRATDGTNISNFYQAGGTTPFSFITSAAITTSGVTITGTVKDTSDACPAGVQGALVFAEGSGFSTTTGADCAYTLGAANNGLAVGFPYDIVVAKAGYSTQRRDAVPAGSTSVAVQLGQGATGGFGGDTTRPHVIRTMPGDKMQNVPGNDSNMKIFVVFDKEMSQTSVLSNGNMVVNDVNVQSGALTNITANGSWAYYSTYTMPFGGSETNVAVWSLSGTNTFGDNKTIAVKATPSVMDTSGNAIQGNLTDGSYSFSFTTGSSASFTGFNSTTGTFADGGTFGQGENIPPHVTTTTPTMGSPSVPRNTKILINFDTSMADDGGGYTLASAVKLFEVSSAGAETDITSLAINAVTLTADKMAATVTLKTTYPSGCAGSACGVFKSTTRYRLKVLGSAKAANSMTMRAPNQATEVAFMSDFTTSSSSDTVAPTIVGSDPTNAATDVASMLGSISVSFDKDMDSSSITTSTMTLAAGSTAVTGTVDYRPQERTAYFMPSRVLTPSTQYTLSLTAGVRGINGTAITAATRTFTTGAADTSAPVVTMMTADDTNISISFSKPMNSAPATDTTNFSSSVLRVANYTVKYGTAGFNATTAGTSLTLPATAQITYDPKNNSVFIQGYRPTTTTTAAILGQQLYVSIASVKDIGGNAISTAGTAPDTANTTRATVQNSATTQGQLGPMTITNDLMKAVGDFKPATFSGNTFGFAPQTEARPFNMMTGTTTIYGMRVSLSRQIPDGGTIVLTFPSGFNISGAKQDINSPKRRDINGPGTGTVTFKCQTNVAGMSAKSCGTGTANTDDTGAAQGGLADDGVVVNANARTITIYVSGATNSEGHDMLDFDIAGIVNSTVPKDMNTSGYTVSITTKNGTTVLETLTSVPFFIQSPGTTTYTLTGTVTATGNTQAGTISVFLDSPMTGPLEATTADFASGATAAYSFANLPVGDYGLRTEPYVTIGTAEFLGKVPPERVQISANTTRNFTLTSATAAGTGTAVTVSVDGPSSEPIDIFANGPSGFRVMQKTLDTNAGAENFTLRLSDGDWMLGVGPQMPKGMMSGPPPAPSYLPPRPVNLRISGTTCVIEGTTTCTKAFTLTASTKQIRGVVKDLASKVIANAEVYAYSPSGGMGNFAKTDTTGAFTLNVTEGVFNVGAMIQGMPPSKEVPVEVTSHATTYLKIDGAATAITPAAAATSFVLKLAKPDYTISGKVTDGTNVINGASVYAYKVGAPGHASAPTDSSGNYSLFVSAGTWMVGAFLPKYGNLTEQTVTVTTANATGINFSPSGTGTFYAVSGTVTVGGVARQGAHVRIKSSAYFNDTFTDTNGAYSFNVPAGTGYIIDGFVAGVGELAPLAAFSVSADTPNKDLTVATLRTITMTFSSSVSRAFVELRSTTTGANVRKEIKNSTTGTLSAPDGSYIVNVDLQGAPIPFSVIAATDGNTTYATTTGIVTVNGDEGLTVTVPTLRTLTITVQDAASTALADSWVELMNPTTGEHFGSKTATNGQVTLRAADGTYFINAMKPGYYRVPTSLTVSANAAQTLTLAAATRTISGTVYIGTTGAPNAFVRADKQGGGFAGGMTDANGQYTLSVAEGVWRVFAKTDGYAEAELSAPVDTTTASATGKDITLTTTVTISAPKSKPMTPSTGGSIEDTSAGIKVNVPANALGSSSSAGNMQVKKTTNFISTETGRPVAAVEISATDANGTPIKTLSDSVTIELSYTVAELAAIASSTDSSINTKTEVETLDIGFWDESVSNWTTLSTTVTYYDSAGAVVTSPAENLSNVSSVKLSALTDHFSLFAPVVPTDPSAPSTPTGFSLGTTTSSTIVLGWTVVSGATGYNIYRSTTSTGTFGRLGSEPTVSSGSTATYTDSGLSASTSYYYKISALNNNGESAATSAVTGTTSATTSSSSSSSGGVVSSSSTSSQTTTTTTTTTTTATTITATNVPVTNTSTVTTVAKGITASTLGVSAINAGNLEVKQTGSATTATTDKKDVASQQLKDMKSVDAKEKKAQDVLTTLESMVTKGTVAPVALSQNVTRYEVKEKTTGKTTSVTRVEQLFAPSKDTKDVTIVMTVPKSVAERASALTFTGIQPEVLQDDPILRWTFAEVMAGETKDLSYQANKNLDKLEVKNVAVAAAPAAVEMAWGFKNGKFQLMPKTEADALHEAEEKAKSVAVKAPVRPETEVAKSAVMKAKVVAKPLVTVKALPHLTAKAAKVVTNVLKRSAIIILPQDKGTAFYLDPKTQKRASLGRPAEAFEVMRSFGKGITNKDLGKIPESMMEGDTTFACKHAGTIFLQVESKGEAWYVHPENCKRYFLNRPADAFELMRKLALGVSNADAAAIPVSEKSSASAAPQPSAVASSGATTSAKPSDKLSPLARPLYNGMKGDDVKTLQTILAQRGYYTGAVSGTMDEATFAAAREMQLKEGLAKATSPGFGTVGPATRAFVNKVLKEEPKPAAKTEAKAAEQTATPAGESALDKLKRLMKK